MDRTEVVGCSGEHRWNLVIDIACLESHMVRNALKSALPPRPKVVDALSFLMIVRAQDFEAMSLCIIGLLECSHPCLLEGFAYSQT